MAPANQGVYPGVSASPQECHGRGVSGGGYTTEARQATVFSRSLASISTEAMVSRGTDTRPNPREVVAWRELRARRGLVGVLSVVSLSRRLGLLSSASRMPVSWRQSRRVIRSWAPTRSEGLNVSMVLACGKKVPSWLVGEVLVLTPFFRRVYKRANNC